MLNGPALSHHLQKVKRLSTMSRLLQYFAIEILGYFDNLSKIENQNHLSLL